VKTFANVSGNDEVASGHLLDRKVRPIAVILGLGEAKGKHGAVVGGAGYCRGLRRVGGSTLGRREAVLPFGKRVIVPEGKGGTPRRSTSSRHHVVLKLIGGTVDGSDTIPGFSAGSGSTERSRRAGAASSPAKRRALTASKFKIGSVSFVT
jgi:hypothetical protein